MIKEEIREALYDAISEIETECTFAVGGIANALPLPGLSIEGVGNIALPVPETQINALISVSEQAPFGKGADTVVDTDVRNCRQVDAEKITFGPRWQQAVEKLTRESAELLGVRGFKVVPNLYKLIVYPPGGFFKAHKDTEKEPGMFATLVIQIPSRYDGGCLVVRHRNEEKVFNFAGGSDTLFFSAAFYGDCEHELQKVNNGHRVCLIYNLLREDNGPIPTLDEQDNVLSQISKAAKMWEDVPTSEGPSKFAMLLEHEYTTKNLAFRMVKGRDAAIVAMLRLSRRFDLHLALVEKHERGTTGNDCYGRTSYRYGDWSDGEDAHHEMDDLIDSDVNVMSWIAENDVPASLGALQIDEEGDMLDGECLFEEDASPDREEYERYTGNAGPMLEYWYHRAVLVMWPKSRSIAMTCSASFAGAVQLALRRAREQDPSARICLEQVVSFAKDNHGRSQGRLAELLEVACTLKHSSSVHSILEFMSRAEVKSVSYPSWRESGGSFGGCCSTKHAKMLFNAVSLFGWKELQQLILKVVAVTSASHVGYCAMLACTLANSTKTLEAANSVAKEACLVMSATRLEDSAAPNIAKMLFSIESCSLEKGTFISRAKELSHSAISEVISSIHSIYSGTKSIARFPDAFSRLVRIFISKGLQKKSATQSHMQATVVWSILLGPRPRNDELLDTFCKAAISSGRGELLRELLTTAKAKCFVGDVFVTKLAAVRASQLNYPRPVPSNRQPFANVPRHPHVTKFLRSDQLTMEYSGFSGIGHARNFCYKHFNGVYNSQEKHSARAQPHGRGADAYVVITKTNGFNDDLLRQYQADQKELAEVKMFLGQSPTGICATHVSNVSLASQRQPLDTIDLTGD